MIDHALTGPKSSSNRISAIHLAIAIHYATRCTEYPDLADAGARQAAEDLVHLGMLEHIHDPADGGMIGYLKTAGLSVWISALCETPLPVLRWVMPERTAA